MPPKPYDDLFIEPPDDYDVVYGDYNTTSLENSQFHKSHCLLMACKD
uniref:Ovule protein n=1 Tax=Ascaris lumbricoides TaxID=6252 RepID=A0A0M3HIA8_ASCLU